MKVNKRANNIIYDCIIIGGGLSGLICGLVCSKNGLKTAVFSGGMNSLHFSSGSIDLFGYTNDHKFIIDPFKYIKKNKRKNKDHPYSRIPLKTIKESLVFFQDELSAGKLSVFKNEKTNHFRITPVGRIKPTFISQHPVFNIHWNSLKNKNLKIAVLNFEGYRDFFPDLSVQYLKRTKIFTGMDIISGTVDLSFLPLSQKNHFESRSIDIARIFETETYLPRISKEIKQAARGSDIAVLPAFTGLYNFSHIQKRISELTNLQIYELSTLPPSILGMRIDNTLKSRLAFYGGVYISNDKAINGEIISGSIDHIHTSNYPDARHSAKYFVLSTGSYLSGGLVSSYNNIQEPVFKLQLDFKRKRSQWYLKNFFDADGHPFLSYGVRTNKNFNPFNKDGVVIKNLFCTGSILSGYNPVREGSGGGVAIASAYFAAQKIIDEIKTGKK